MPSSGTDFPNSRKLKLNDLEIKVISGRQLLRHMESIARLRISVFRDYPYLYKGDMEYEKKYLATYMNKPDAMTVLVLDKGVAVGASTALPLRDETEEVQAPFLQKGIDPAEVFYFGESVLASSYRGLGLGVRFFEERELFARSRADTGGASGTPFRILAFCAVERSADHPLRPDGYKPLNLFWKNRGFTKYPDMKTTFWWKDIGEPEETEKQMIFWLKELAP